MLRQAGLAEQAGSGLPLIRYATFRGAPKTGGYYPTARDEENAD